MNKITRQLAEVLQSKIDNEKSEFQYDGLSAEQIEEINSFTKAFSRSSPFFPYPLKAR